MTSLQLTALFIISVFYFAYFTKMFLQHRKGVQTDQMGKGKKEKKVRMIEIATKVAACGTVAAELVSILVCLQWFDSFVCWVGIFLAAVGVLLFVLSVVTMRDSWRAGIPATDKTDLVTTGIYRISRNPAFLGFDLVYIGILIAFFNLFHLLIVGFAVCMFHLLILQEERFLTATFGENYLAYRKRVGRYFIL